MATGPCATPTPTPGPRSGWRTRAGCASTPPAPWPRRAWASSSACARPRVTLRAPWATSWAWACCSRCAPCGRPSTTAGTRSEEHTSELQSPCNLVCRLLLEKKNNTYLTAGPDLCHLLHKLIGSVDLVRRPSDDDHGLDRHRQHHGDYFSHGHPVHL